MNIPALDEYVANHRVSGPFSHRYSLEDKGRTPEDVRNDVVAGHKALGTDFSKLTDPQDLLNEHERAEWVGMQPNLDRYRERGVEVGRGNNNLPLPGLENADFKLTEAGKKRQDEENKDSYRYGVHPGSKAAIVIDSSSLPGVLEKGKFTNSFEVGGGIGDQKPAEWQEFNEDGDVVDYYSNARRRAEEELFGVPYESNHAKYRPVYGLVRPGDDHPFYSTSQAGHYGDAVVDLKDPGETRKHTTISYGDSLNKWIEGEAEIDDPTRSNTHPEELKENIDEHGYTEMHWHEHPEVSDIEHVHLSGKPQGENHMVGQQFANLGIPVTNHWVRTEVQPSLFEDTPDRDLPTVTNRNGETYPDTRFKYANIFRYDVSRPVRRGEPELED